MKARVAGIAGSVLALTVVGGFAAASTFQSAPAVPVRVVQPAMVGTVAPVVAPTAVAPAPAPVVKAPAPVQSTQAPVVVASKPKVVVVPKVVAPAKPASDGAFPIVKDSNGNVLPPPPIPGNAPQIDGHGVPIPTPTP